MMRPSSELQHLGKLLRSQAQSLTEAPSIEELRLQMEAICAEARKFISTDDVKCQKVDALGVPCHWIDTPRARKDKCLIYFHGGGYALGSLDTHFELMARLSRACRTRVLGVDYRLAPEHVFPVAVEDGLKSYQWLLQQDIDPANIILAGDSAGGGLVMATLLALREQGFIMPAAGVVMSPWVDLTISGDSIHTRRSKDPTIVVSDLHVLSKIYAGNEDPSNVGMSPIYADLSGLPPLLIQVGDHELLLDDAKRLAYSAISSGIPTSFQIWNEAFHVFQIFPHLPESVDALQKIGDFYQEWSP